MPHTVMSGLLEFVRETGLSPERAARAIRAFEVAASLWVTVQSKEQASSLGSVMARSKSDLRRGGPGIVTYGGQPYNFGAEFGAKRYKQFKEWRGDGDDAGYFFWPTVRAFRDQESLKQWMTEMWTVVKPVFPS